MRIFARKAKPLTIRDIRNAELAQIREEVGSRTYGFNGTIHHTEEVSVEVDAYGHVVSVWFRCQPLPFKETVVRQARADEMHRMYAHSTMPRLVAVEVVDQ